MMYISLFNNVVAVVSLVIHLTSYVRMCSLRFTLETLGSRINQIYKEIVEPA